MHFLPSSDFTCFDSNGARENSGEQQVVRRRTGNRVTFEGGAARPMLDSEHMSRYNKGLHTEHSFGRV